MRHARELIRRLIYAAMGPAAETRFPSDESVQYSGWDGICTVATGVAPIPDGTSGWEIGAQRRGIGGKADGDFAKRSKDSLGLKRETTTFVFATPQPFPGKDAWAAEKRAWAFGAMSGSLTLMISSCGWKPIRPSPNGWL